MLWSDILLIRLSCDLDTEPSVVIDNESPSSHESSINFLKHGLKMSIGASLKLSQTASN